MVDVFIALAEQTKFFRNAYRVNVHPDQEVRIDKNGCKWLRRGPMSVTVREGPLLAKAQEWFPECNAVTVNRKRATSPPMARHKDGKTSCGKAISASGVISRKARARSS